MAQRYKRVAVEEGDARRRGGDEAGSRSPYEAAERVVVPTLENGGVWKTRRGGGGDIPVAAAEGG